MTRFLSIRIINGKPQKVIVDENGNIINRSPNKDELRGIEVEHYKITKRTRIRYKIGNICPRCIEENNVTEKSVLYIGNVCREKDKDGAETGECVCHDHWARNYQMYSPNSCNNVKKSIANCRTGNQNPNHSNTKGDIDVEVVCELYGWINLNKRYDKYNTEIDCFDEKTGLLHQVRGICYNPKYGSWGFSHLEEEWYKKYESMVCVCKSEDKKRIEDMYEFPLKLLKELLIKGISIKCDSERPYRRGWYEKYRIKDEQKLMMANDILRRILIQKSG